MPTWFRFKDSDGDELVYDLGTFRQIAIRCPGGIVAVCGNSIHPDDADRVWGELCAMCETPKLYGCGWMDKLPEEAQQPATGGPEVRRWHGEFLFDNNVSWTVFADIGKGFPRNQLDALGEFIAECVGGTYVGGKS